MTKSADITNTDATNTCQVKWSESHSGPWHTDTLNPGDTKSYNPIATGTGLSVSGLAGFSVKDTGATPLSVIESLASTIAPGATASFALPGASGDVVVVG